MGFFKEMFSNRKEYPELNADSPAARQLAEFERELEELSHQVNDKLEVVPSDQRAFVFIGKPPKKFGLAWIEDHKIKNLKSLADEGNVPPERLPHIVDELREAYEQSRDEPRFGTSVGDSKVVVAPSEQLEHTVEEIIHKARS